MNIPAASNDAHINVAHQSRDFPMLPWTKNHRIRPMKLGNNNRSTTSKLESSLQSIHLALFSSATLGNNERRRHIEK
jgi:hypothetical protein